MRLPSPLHRLLGELGNLLRGQIEGLKQQSVEAIRLEYLELENAFLTLVLGSAVGMPLMPLGLSMELLPLVKEELAVMERRHRLGGDTLAEFFGSLGGEW